MLTESQIEEKYKIVFVDDQRYYRCSLAEKDYSLEYATPLSLEISGKSFIDTSWKQLLIDVCISFLKEKPDKASELLNLKPRWNGKHQFFPNPGKNLYQVGNGVYLLCNQTAIHACWLLREVLLIFGADLSKSSFIIHRPPSAEPHECRVFYEDKTKKQFRYYYSKLLKYPEEKAEQVLRNVDKLNKVLPRLSKAYDNFYLIDNNNVFANYKAKFLEYLTSTLCLDEKNIKLANRYLTILGDFYKAIR